MRRKLGVAAAVILIAGLLAGCGSKGAESVVKDLDKVVDKMESYQGSGKMILHTGQQPLEYKVEVWYQKPQFYRIALTNAKRDITQIVLRNQDGVFVLTPSLNKSYRFQSDWPENQGQVYLYQTLVQSILMDNSRQFTTDKDAYVFDVMASNYQNGSFARQKIWLNKEDYAPQKVEVTDANANLMVEVLFDSFAFGTKFESTAFDMQQNMAQPPGGQPSGTGDSSAAEPGLAPTEEPLPSEDVNGEEGADGPAAGEEGEEEGAGDEDATAPVEEFAMIEPEALPEGVVLKDASDVQLGDRKGVMLRYTGAYDFTIVEMASREEAAALEQGIMLDLGFTMGHLTGDATRTLTWSYDGVEFRLTTIDLPEDEMVRVAQSMAESSGK